MMPKAGQHYPHRIRLRGPWDCATAGDVVPPHRVTMPCRWVDAGLAGYRGRARFVRKFGYPGNVDSSEHVWITCTGATGCREVRLNGHLLTDQPSDTFAFDVTALLSDRNQLEVVIDGDSDDAGLWGEVAMEIRRDGYLADVKADRTPLGIEVSGKVAGTAPHPLEVYTIVDGRHADYRMVQPTAEGTPFRVELPPESRTIRVELIHISSIWYEVELANSEEGHKMG